MATPSSLLLSSSSSAPFPSTLPLPVHLLRPNPSPLLLPRSASSTSNPSPSPSLADQLRPLSRTLLRDPPPSAPLARSPKSTWVNPSRPRPSALSLRRQSRSHVPRRPSAGRMAEVFNAVSSISDDADDASFSAALSELLSEAPDGETALGVLGSLHPWKKARRFFRWLQSLEGFQVTTIFYNVLMKSLRNGRQFDLVEEHAQEMVTEGIEMDNFTYATVITCAKRRREFDCAVGWFERMYRTGIVPDEVTYSAVLDVYAQSGKVQEAMALFERGRASGWTPDVVAFSVLGKMFGEAGDHDGVQYVLEEIRNLGIQPNLVLYNTLIEATGKAGKPGLARSLFEKLLASGLEPDEKVLTSLVKIYSKARWGKDALELWENIRARNWPTDKILYNALLKLCAELGLEEAAEELFVEMKQSDQKKPDSWTYTTMLFMYANIEKVEKVHELFIEMQESEVVPTVMTCTSLIQCFGKARRMDDVVNVFDALITKGGIRPNDQLCGCLLSVLGLCEKEEMSKILNCLEKANPRISRFIQMLGDEKVRLGVVKEEFRGILNDTCLECRTSFCNCLIDICRNQKFPDRRPQELFRLGIMHGLYPHLHNTDAEEWSLDIRSLSLGAAHTAFKEWMRTLSGKLKTDDDALPQSFSVITGRDFSKGLANTFGSHLVDLSAPFHQSGENTGFFVARREDLVPWIQERAAILV